MQVLGVSGVMVALAMLVLVIEELEVLVSPKEMQVPVGRSLMWPP